jgi:hypothetical protein
MRDLELLQSMVSAKQGYGLGGLLFSFNSSIKVATHQVETNKVKKKRHIQQVQTGHIQVKEPN